MTAAMVKAAAAAVDGRWCWPIVAGRYDTATLVRAAEGKAISELGLENLRRLHHHDPCAPGWAVIRRLLQPLEAANASLDSPPSSHRRRAMADATAVILLRCAQVGRSYWGWSVEEWTEVIGADQAGFRRSAPGWADDAVRSYVSSHAYLLGGFNEFHRLGSFQRLTMAWRIFGRDRVDAEISNIRAVLDQWGYRLGSDDDRLLPMVVCQLFLLNRSPLVEDLTTGLFDRIRSEHLFGGARLNTLHAVQRAVAALGFCQPPVLTNGGSTTPGPEAPPRSGPTGWTAGTPPRR